MNMARIFLLIGLSQLYLQTLSAGTPPLFNKYHPVYDVAKDTMVEDPKQEDEVIDEVVRAGLNIQKEKLRYVNQVTKYGFKNLFSDYSYNPTMPYSAQINPNAAFFIRDYMRIHGNSLQKMKEWGQPYFNLIENVLQQYGLPRELKYIAVIESNLNTGATSNMGASGPWQFMPYTARDYGLTVNNFVDDRRDYFKSTHAASKYLLSLYKQFHDWLLVMAAYNGGPGRVYDAIKQSGSNNFWDLQYYLPEESRTYVKRFIATHYIMEGVGANPSFLEKGLPEENQTIRTNYGKNLSPGKVFAKAPELSDSEWINTEVLPVGGKFNSGILAKTINMDKQAFDRYNPLFDAMISANGSYELRLPADKMQLFISNKYQILNESVEKLLRGVTIPDNRTVYKKVTPSRK
jgi:membrane-bound lytic murein transglycosylase D